MLKDQIEKLLESILKELGVQNIKHQIERPADLAHGDYSTNIALIAAKKSGMSPRDLAETIVKRIEQRAESLGLEKIEVAGPGFINFWISKVELSKKLEMLLSDDEKITQSTNLTKQKIMIEFAHPNTHKSLHIGHLRNLSIGESLVRLYEAAGAKVIRANYQGDVGMHIAKAMYGLLDISPYSSQLSSISGTLERVKFLGAAYAAGSQAYEKETAAKEKIHDYNYLIYASAQRFQEEKGIETGTTDYLQFVKGKSDEIDKIYKIWVETRQWSLDYYEMMYKILGVHFDRYYFESECLSGVDMAYAAVKQGVLKDSEGAIIFDGREYGLDTRVFVNSLGLPTYEAKELALSQKEFSEFGQLNKIIHVVGPEQASFFQITFKVEELLGLQNGQQLHLAYGWVRLKEGKMSSRLGNVITADQLVTKVKELITVISETSNPRKLDESTAEKIAIAAIKYSFLKVSTTHEIAFDLQESVSAEGNSGPYLQYTYARTQSVLRRAQNINIKLQAISYKLEQEESLLLRLLYIFDEIVVEAAEKNSPNIVANYIYNLASVFNIFYQKHPILKAESEIQELRLVFTSSVGKTIKKGLYLLGIDSPEKM